MGKHKTVVAILLIGLGLLIASPLDEALIGWLAVRQFRKH